MSETGRPPKYTPEFVAELAKKLQDYTEASQFPTFARFAFNCKIDKRIATKLCRDSEEFSEAYKNMEAKQEAVLCEGGITGKTNPAVTIFLLKNNHGYKDRQDHNVNGNAGFLADIVRKAEAVRKRKEAEGC